MLGFARFWGSEQATHSAVASFDARMRSKLGPAASLPGYSERLSFLHQRQFSARAWSHFFQEAQGAFTGLTAQVPRPTRGAPKSEGSSDRFLMPCFGRKRFQQMGLTSFRHAVSTYKQCPCRYCLLSARQAFQVKEKSAAAFPICSEARLPHQRQHNLTRCFTIQCELLHSL